MGLGARVTEIKRRSGFRGAHRLPWGQRETELPVLGADTLTHFSAQGLFAQ